VVDVLTGALLGGGIFVAVVAALNLFGLARGRLRSDSLGQAQSLASGMMGAGVAGFVWPPFPTGDAPPAPWRFFWMGVFAAGVALLVRT